MDTADKVRKGEELDWKNLNNYLLENIPEVQGAMQVSQFHGGHANLTYLLTFGDTELVLRRPPFGKIAPGAHDMKREYRVLSKLYNHFPQAPRAYHLCLNEDVIGAKFVIMERKTGIVVRKEMPACFQSLDNIEERMTLSLIKAQSNLHTVDVAAANLSDMGRPDGYVHRQLEGWEKRWSLSETEPNKNMSFLFNALQKEVPEPQAVSILHNDIKFDNCQFQPDNPDEITAIFDWDMSTLGDPLMGFGTTLGYWPEPKMDTVFSAGHMVQGDFPDKAFVKKKYAEYTGFNLENIAWYEAFAYGKTATILQQLYKRYVDGETKDKRMASLGDFAYALSVVAKKIAKTL